MNDDDMQEVEEVSVCCDACQRTFVMVTEMHAVFLQMASFLPGGQPSGLSLPPNVSALLSR